MLPATKCSSSEESIVSVRPLILIQLTLLMMSTWLLETFRELE